MDKIRDILENKVSVDAGIALERIGVEEAASATFHIGLDILQGYAPLADHLLE